MSTTGGGVERIWRSYRRVAQDVPKQSWYVILGLVSRRLNKTLSTPATAALERAGIEFVALPYEHDPRNRHYGDEAASALGLPPEHVFKTLVVNVDSSMFAIVVLPVAHEADLKAVAAAVGGKKAALAQVGDVQRLTGYVLGGVSPLGGRTALPTVIDSSAQSLERMYVSGGRRGFDIGLAPAALAELTDAHWARVAR